MNVSPGKSTGREHNLAVFIDLENLAQGYSNQKKTRFEIQKVLERLLEKGKLIVKKPMPTGTDIKPIPPHSMNRPSN